MTASLAIDIEQIVQSIFSIMLNMELERANDWPPSDCESLLTSIQISGDWMGGVVLEMSPSMARSAAAAMLQSPEDCVTSADQEDAGAELVNIIGGNVKCLLEGACTLSLPTVVGGRNIGLRIPHTELIDDISLGSDAGFVRVRLYAKTAK
jgi:CheY-specific phosphatase CheX